MIDQPIRVLLVADDKKDYLMIQNLLSKIGRDKFELQWASCYRQALDKMESMGAEVMLINHTLDEQDGLIFLREAQAKAIRIPGIFLTDQADPEKDAEAMKLGAADYLIKGALDFQLLDRSIRYAISRVRAEERTRSSEEKYRTLVECSREAIFTVNHEGIFLYINPEGAYKLGGNPEDYIGRTLWEVFPKEMADNQIAYVKQVLKTGKGVVIEVPTEVKGQPRWHSTSLQPLRVGGQLIEVVLGIATDVTEKKKLEEQLQQSQKMDAIGQLAAGIAHDFNNIITAIAGFSEIVMQNLGENHAMYGDTKEILNASLRGASLTRQLLAFSQKQVLRLRSIDLNALVANIEKMLRRLIGGDIKLRTAYTESPAFIKADPGQIEQVLINLAINGRDAMKDGGILTITTSYLELDESFACCHPDVRPGPYIMLTVSDNGCGMNVETRTRIFEPFFTTKQEGKGTGLGLSTVYGIVKQSGGCISVVSEVGYGTTFRILFPWNRETQTEALAPVGQSCLSTPLSGTILVVEDDRSVRALMKKILEKDGFKVLEAQHGKEALTLAQDYRDNIDLLIADLMVPQINGLKVAEELLIQRPGLKVLYISGYPNGKILDKNSVLNETCFIQKPFKLEALRSKVFAILGFSPTCDHQSESLEGEPPSLDKAESNLLH